MRGALQYATVVGPSVALYATGCVVAHGDSAFPLRWRGPDAPSVSGPFMVGVKKHVPWVGTPWFKLWLNQRFVPGSDMRGVADAARAATSEDKELYKDPIDHCLLFMTYSKPSDGYEDQEKHVRAALPVLVQNGGRVMETWVLDMWAAR